MDVDLDQPTLLPSGGERSLIRSMAGGVGKTTFSSRVIYPKQTKKKRAINWHGRSFIGAKTDKNEKSTK